MTYNNYRCDLCTFFPYLLKFKVVQENPVKDGPTSVGRFYLVDKKFNFKYYTSVLTTSAGSYNFIYDHGWRELEDGKIMIVMNPKQAEFWRE